MSVITKQERRNSSKDVLKYRETLNKGSEGKHPYVIFLGLRTFDTQHLLKRIETGLSYTSLERFRKNINLPMRDLAELLQISLRTLNRRKKTGKLEPDESDRLVRISRLYGKTLELFEGDNEAAHDWLSRKQIGLGGARPFDLIRSEVGAREVEALIGRLEYGVFS